MDKVSAKLQVFFEEPFWIGICERLIDDKLSVCKITFGTEPKDYEVHEYILKNWYKLRFSQAVECDEKEAVKINPKRVQRNIKKQVQNIEIGTKSQNALKLQHDENKLQRKTHTKEEKELEKKKQFELKQQKKKEKHKGR